ncbi:uncharacterized protein LAESUDRAFT_761677 [Laetiporus sulphureus 93-53]|uniref:Uncharacterized protein n=1 Tax=Laetiporus sulphureus 93-53 TaxID=1314785 RepID=A0A165CZR5_9APHY|nr:uncharacterized protein LAESUDRAFT_761677 [Laetiporus sulphureus 93-53]KZT03838.1 hypothetical protein LAESUDRAFT_761677 [Laetiporus sulphureus 93-53]
MTPAVKDYKLSPSGLKSLNLHLGRRSEDSQYKEQLQAAKMAFLVAGMHQDDNHALEQDGFHALWYTSQEQLSGEPGRREWCRFYYSLLSLTMDMLTAIDRISGGTSVMAHSGGYPQTLDDENTYTVSPHVYYSPGLCTEIPQLKSSVDRIIREFVDGMAVPVMSRWERAWISSTNHVLPLPTDSEHCCTSLHTALPAGAQFPGPSSHLVLSYSRVRAGSPDCYWQSLSNSTSLAASRTQGCEDVIPQNHHPRILKDLDQEVRRLQDEIRANERELDRLYQLIADIRQKDSRESP